MNLDQALSAVRDRLLQSLNSQGFWQGHLSSSALSTATAVSALSLAEEPADLDRIEAAVSWLSQTQCSDGGWGDTPDSPSNLSTTLLAASALSLAFSRTQRRFSALDAASGYIHSRAGRSPEDIAAALRAVYGHDRTFAAPILMNCALAGLVRWDEAPHLPFELAALPHASYGMLRLHVVSYALPALIAIGLAVHHHRPPARPLRLVREFITPSVLRKLQRIQPDGGGFLEATPLTSFVAMALISTSRLDHPVTGNCLAFLRESQRPDGSWPIDSNLSVWLTTAAVGSLHCAGELPGIDARQTRDWILRRQYRVSHPYTNTRPGGWAWTHLPGGVPDLDDTSGAILALHHLAPDAAASEALDSGIRWILQLQNSDGGWPTFCRGWGKLPFDQSAPDLTAHALRALAVYNSRQTCPLRPRQRHNLRQIPRAIRRGVRYLFRTQLPDGSWLPLWFGNQSAPRHANPVLGTARVLRAWTICTSATPGFSWPFNFS